ncbi:MAG: pentapeptide repeat-containing protein [Solirubrobacteraceae bacterium]
MCPRNPCALVATTLCLCLGFAASADAGPSVSLSCARPSGNCSGKKLFGRHLWKQDLTRTRWVGSKLLMASFRYSDLYGSSFRNAHMRRVDLSYGNRTRADFRNAELTLANLSHADFYGSNFRKADVRGARLIGTRMDNTNLFGANFEGAVFIGVSWHGVRLCHTVQPNGVTRNDNCPGSGGNSGPGGGACCFPGKDPSKGKDDSGKGDGSGENADDDGAIVGDL